MRKVLIVDDEPFVRSSIISLLDWNSLGYTFPCEAANGKEALDIVNKNDIDLVLLDMSMPVMTGMDFLKKLNLPANGLMPAVIVLSAYDDFSLVREAFKLGVTNYALKSEIDESSLLDLLAEVEYVLSDLPDRTSGNTKTIGLQDPEMKRLALNELLTVPVTPQSLSLLDHLGIRLDFPLSIFCIKMQDPEGFNKSNDLEQRRRLQNLICSTALDVVSAFSKTESFLTMSGEYCMLLSFLKDEYEKDMDQAAVEIARRIKQYINIIVVVDIENNIAELQEIHYAWQSLRTRKIQASRIVMQARRYIDEHYKQTRITLDEIAEASGVSRNHLSAQFRKETGSTLTEYIANCRITEAAKLLQESKLLVYEIASVVGYANVEHFSRQFKSIMGCSPNKYVGLR